MQGKAAQLGTTAAMEPRYWSLLLGAERDATGLALGIVVAVLAAALVFT